MRSSDAFPSKYLKASEIKGKDVPVILDRIEHEEMADGEMKYVLYFIGRTKGLVLNKTNWDTIEEAYGDSDDWPGKPAMLFTVKTKDPTGKTVDGIRIKPAPQQRQQAAKPRQASGGGGTVVALPHTELDPPPDDDVQF
jgi:hypothetical protein